ncbi:MAG: serine/threonine protein kinase [Planctomycetes bacterium]|nr:serine/threonine protein kinase [Planctomycetota bacterium]
MHETLPPQGKRFCQHQGVVGEQGKCDAGELDTAVLEQARSGFRVLSGVFTGVLALALVIGFLLNDPHVAAEVASAAMIRQVFLLLLSLGMFVIASRRSFCPRALARIGHGYQLLGALAISLSIYLPAPDMHPPLSHLSWLGVWIVVFPLVAPSRLRVAIGLSLACTATVPLAMAITWLRGAPFPGALEVFAAILPYLFCAGIAVVSASLVNRLSTGISDAREQLMSMGTYELVERIGVGGMGEVWHAEHRLLRRPAAIKVIRQQQLEGATPPERQAVIARFEREATTLASLRSPHTVDLYDFGRTADGAFYYVMELLEGLDLERLVREHGPLPAGRVISILLQVCASLAEAHTRGMVHRDLKPANVMLCRMGLEVDFVKVLDFGLVSTVQTKRQADVKLTGENTILGTPAYMSPEQARAKDSVDARSDVYSLGCIAYFLLTGRQVFEQGEVLAMILDHVGTTPERPSRRLEKPIPEGLEQLVLDCLAKDPAERPQSAHGLAQRLRALEEVEPWTELDAHRWWAVHEPEKARAKVVAPAPDPVHATTQLVKV